MTMTEAETDLNANAGLWSFDVSFSAGRLQTVEENADGATQAVHVLLGALYQQLQAAAHQVLGCQTKQLDGQCPQHVRQTAGTYQGSSAPYFQFILLQTVAKITMQF